MNKGKVECLLPEGKENAISSDNLCKILGLKNKRTLQLMIEKERQNGALILSHYSGGYYTSHNPVEIAEFTKTMENRAKSIYVSLRSAREHLKTCEKQRKVKK